MNPRKAFWQDAPERSLSLLINGYRGYLAFSGKSIPEPENKGKLNISEKPLLFVGWDSADWNLLNTLMNKGFMPFLSTLSKSSAQGHLASLKPMLSPMLWTSIATGKYPFRHGVIGFTEWNESGELTPISSLSRRCKAFWNILSDHEITQNLVGWWPSHPVEEIKGCMVSNRFLHGAQESKVHVYPSELEAILNQLQVKPEELPLELIWMFFDAEKGKPNPKSIEITAKILATCFSTHNIFTYLLEHHPSQLNAVYFDAPDHMAHLAMQFIDDKENPMNLLLPHIYKLLDTFLAHYFHILGEKTNLLLVSDHGFKQGKNLPTSLGNEPSAPEAEHEILGLFLAYGNQIHGKQIFGASLLDVAPTLLQWLGLPHATDMDGRVLHEIFDFQVKSPISTYENLSLELPFIEKSNAVSDDYTLHLQELGYLAKNPSQSRLQDENTFYLGRSYADAGLWIEALREFKTLIPNDKKEFPLRYWVWALQAAWAAKDFEYAQQIWQTHHGIVEPSSEQYKILFAVKTQTEENWTEAEALYEQLCNEYPEKSEYLYHWAQCNFSLKQFSKGLKNIEKALDLNQQSAQYQVLKGDFYWALEQKEQALEAYFDAVALRYFLPWVHYKIGLLLLQIQQTEAGIQALQVCRMQAPNYLPVRVLLRKIITHPNNTELKRLDSEIKALQKGEIIVVTGVPRSGTSLMMQILEAAGLDIFQDQNRTPDENNPYGYYEHESIKELPHFPVLDKAVGKVVKVLNPLIQYLPQPYSYKIICMSRPVDAIAKSRIKMLQSKNYPFKIQELIEKEDKSLNQIIHAHPEWEVLKISYEKLLKAPEETLYSIREFLALTVSIDELKNVIRKK